MQLSFDPRDRNSATAVLAAILVLHPNLADSLEGSIAAMNAEPSATLAEHQAMAAGDIGSDVDAAAAFGAGPTAQPAAATATVPVGSTATPTSAPAASAVAPSNPNPNAAPAAPASSGGATAGAASPNPGNVEVDANGLPWDGRIHAGTKSKVAGDVWRKKVGVTPEETAAVEAELRAALAAPAAPTSPVTEVAAAPIPPAPVAVPVPPAPVAAVPVPPAAPPAPAPTPPVAPTAPGPVAATPAVSDFAGLMRKITGLQAAGRLSVEDTAANCTALGIASIRDLIARPDLVPSFDALLPDAA